MGGENVWATIYTGKRKMEVYYRAKDQNVAVLIKEFDYELNGGGSNLTGTISGKPKMVYDVLTLFGNPCIAFPPMNALNTTYTLAPHTIRIGETDWEGHPGRVEVRGRAGYPKKG